MVKQQTGIGNMQVFIGINNCLETRKSAKHNQQMTATSERNNWQK